MITEEEILEIAVLSKLYVPEEQLEQLTKDMAEILAFADTINTAGAQVEVCRRFGRIVQCIPRG